MTRYKKQDPEISRRKFVTAALGGSAAIGVGSLVTVLGTAKPVFRLTRDKMPPLKGDILVYASGDKTGQPVVVADLGDKITRAWPQGKNADGTPVIRSGDPNNILALYRYPKGQIEVPTNLEATINGEIVAYSDICMHAGCSVGDSASSSIMNCPCHSGQYDPKHGCKVVGGPPKYPLAQLPIKAEGDNIVVGDFFLTHPYPYMEDEPWEKFKKEVEAQLA